jgi:hypothetical protein
MGEQARYGLEWVSMGRQQLLDDSVLYILIRAKA